MAKKKTVLAKMVELETVSVSVDEKPGHAKSSETSHSDDLSKGQSQKHQSKSKGSKKHNMSPLSLIGETLKRWISPKTVHHLQTSNSVVEDEGVARFSDPKIQMGYAKLCKRLETREVEMDKLVQETVDGEGKGQDKKPGGGDGQKKLPDYQALKEEAEAFQLRVTEFVTGKRPKDLVTEKKIKEPEIYLPTVDAYDQQQIRIRIVLDKLDKSLSTLLVPLGLRVQDVSVCLRELVYTFNLEKDTIVFKPWEWTLVSLFMLKMLALKHPTVREAFERDSSTRFFTTMLQGIHQTLTDLDDLVQQLVS